MPRFKDIYIAFDSPEKNRKLYFVYTFVGENRKGNKKVKECSFDGGES